MNQGSAILTDLVISKMHCVSWDRENGELVPGVVAKD